MKRLPQQIAAVLLGGTFIVLALDYFFRWFAVAQPLPGSPAAVFEGAMIHSGYFAFVKGIEIVGGILVLVPRLRPIGLLALGPVLVNIVCFHAFLRQWQGFFPLPFGVCVLALFLLWTCRGVFFRLYEPQH
jgi:putative oxidoreductase